MAASVREEEWMPVGTMTQSGWRAVEVNGGYWMLMHTRYDMLMRDLGWFESRDAAESKALELQRMLGTVRRTIVHGYDPSMLN
jgi:hypothetical protein